MAEIVIALDAPSRSEALRMVDRLGEAAAFYKVGLELYTRAGPDVVRELRARDKRVFLDLKLHDIPNTVAGAVRAAVDLDVELLTIHASGGAGMLRAAVEAAEGRTALIGVTLLTSLTPNEVDAAWGRSISSMREEVVRLASLAQENALPGVVVSVQEAEAVRRRLGPDLDIVTPGIRLAGDDANDQARIGTPSGAARAGATHLVIGRAVTASADPARALATVRRDLEAAGKAG